MIVCARFTSATYLWILMEHHACWNTLKLLTSPPSLSHSWLYPLRYVNHLWFKVLGYKSSLLCSKELFYDSLAPPYCRSKVRVQMLICPWLKYIIDCFYVWIAAPSPPTTTCFEMDTQSSLATWLWCECIQWALEQLWKSQCYLK